MSERKVLTKYYPPDFDPRQLERRRGPKNSGPKTQAVRIMAPFSMRCTACGEYGRKFNARKETPVDEKYLGIQIFRFSFRCTRCSTEIIIRTDPQRNDYATVKGAVRNQEVWRNKEEEAETIEQRLDRLEREEAEAAGEEAEGRNAMAELEAKNEDARREMAAADALDEIRHRNARIQRNEKDGVDFADYVVRPEDEERERQEREDDEAARRAFAAAREKSMADMLGEEEIIEEVEEPAEAGPSSSSSSSSATTAGAQPAPAVTSMPPPPPRTASTATPGAAPAPFKRAPKKKVDYAAKLGIKKKTPLV
ncbi:CWC16 protein [Plectosphaerella plurivora]|uniref:Splicing factor YJU2 n=1 Tax=Plectosphaerella plurivora TaxID=936078 RepID=A0A9P8V9Y5_9PEZI|nr:CWC16 protein [Plectosphaerella plurivora]